MQITTIVALLSLAVAANCQFGVPGIGHPGVGGPLVPPPVPGFPGAVPFGGLPVVPPFGGLGFGGLGFGGLGFGGLGFGGLGFPFGLGFGFPFGLGFGFRGGFIGRGGRGRGRRDEMNMKVDDVKVDGQRAIAVEPIVLCSISSEEKLIACQGLSHTFNCTVRPQISSLKSVQIKIDDLDLIKREGETSVLRLVVPGKRITTVNAGKDISVVLWSGLEVAKSADLIGFEVADEQCWSQVQALASSLRPEELRVSLSIVA